MTEKCNHAGQSVYSSASYGEKPSSWQNPPTAPNPLTLPESQRVFIRLMRHVESVENQNTIEALKLPSEYTGRALSVRRVDDRINTFNEWNETLHELLNKIELENDRPFADGYVTALFSYNFVEHDKLHGYRPHQNKKDHEHDQEQKKHQEIDRRFRRVPKD